MGNSDGSLLITLLLSCVILLTNLKKVIVVDDVTDVFSNITPRNYLQTKEINNKNLNTLILLLSLTLGNTYNLQQNGKIEY